MRRFVLLSASMFLSCFMFFGPVAEAASDEDLKAALKHCKTLADPKSKDECVSNAHNRYGKGKGGEHSKSSPGNDEDVEGHGVQSNKSQKEKKAKQDE